MGDENLGGFMKVYKIIALLVFALVILFMAVAKPYRISGDCMEPAITDGKLYFLNRLSPYIHDYKAGDIIVFSYEEKPWIARIAALEEEVIHIQEGTVLVNDAPWVDNTINRNWVNWDFGTYAIEGPFKVPKGHVFVLSDNLSAKHDDSRVFGPIPQSSISGVIW